MMPDYAKMKNADLEALLKVRGLPHTGKKADLIARLQEHDKQKLENPAEDEIDWDDDEDTTPAQPATTTTTQAAATTPAAPASNKEEPKAQVEASKPVAATANDTTATATNGTNKAAEPAADATAASFASGLAATSVDEELEKRRKRIERFRNPNDAESNKKADEELRTLERIERFKDSSITKNVDAALPERQKRKRDGGGDGDEEGSRGGFKRRGNRRFRGGRGGGGRGRGDRQAART